MANLKEDIETILRHIEKTEAMLQSGRGSVSEIEKEFISIAEDLSNLDISEVADKLRPQQSKTVTQKKKRFKIQKAHKKKFLEKRLHKVKDGNPAWKKWWEKQQAQFKPQIAPLFKIERGFRELQALALSENDGAIVQLNPSSGQGQNRSNVKTGEIELTFAPSDSDRLKKIITMHEAAHLTITPITEELPRADKAFVEKKQKLVNFIEDTRINRYIVFKYRGIARYFESELKEENNPFVDMSVGDLIDYKMDPELFEQYKQQYKLLKYTDEIRACVTFKDVIELAKKIDIEDPSAADQIPNLGDMERVMGGNCDNAPIFQDDDTQIDTKRQVPKDRFLTSYDHVSTVRIDRNLEKLLLKKVGQKYRTREGKLGKIDPVRMLTDQQIFERKRSEKTMPHIYIVLDGSGSMTWPVDGMFGRGETRKEWQKQLAISLLDVFEKMDLDYTVVTHSGDNGEFWWTRLEKNEISYLDGINYTLDGYMLETLFEDVMPSNQKAIVFYFSDGEIPAQDGKNQAALTYKYNLLAQKKNIPIFGIGLQSPGVQLFKHWHVVHTNDDFKKVLNQIARQIRNYF